MTGGAADRVTGKRRLLIVAGAAIASDELLETVVERSSRGPVELIVLMPLSPYRGEPGLRIAAGGTAERRLREALARFRAAGLYVHDATFCRGDPVHEVVGIVASEDVDEIVVVTPRRRFQGGARSSLAKRLHAVTGLPLVHVRGVPTAPRRHAGRSWRRITGRALLAVGLVLLALAGASAVEAGPDRVDSSTPIR